ncbi:hypothetical protein [Lactococcus formosensis]|uniref:Phage protein n=1 Tax=Lactococcus formosensis TaxID=1281486 RepID=A0A9X4NWS0_9LACT|nr:hypothetical protein [Lactococcus formosensis]MDG6126447.1 hypothetical protein [Lactococcus formosensis]MDG6131865.1 hypothetical protein [Lactococcus formosensis]MDG6133862.1 hypothetical protein [Lactococcus formosensis]MDG6140512.1 hypothetical protein [Lactococcus formosensis]MDG6145054.1 hypothetical protein [Lactococcus formosensis]
MKDMLDEINSSLKKEDYLKNICIKSFERPESLEKSESSIVIIPLGPPQQIAKGSNMSLSKHFIYQINVEAAQRMEAKNIQRKVELILQSIGFYQAEGGLEEYFKETNRYVDARVYEGNSMLYEDF